MTEEVLAFSFDNSGSTLNKFMTESEVWFLAKFVISKHNWNLNQILNEGFSSLDLS